MRFPIWKLTAEMVGLFVAMALLLFIGAGTIAWAAGWVFLAIFYLGGIAIIAWLLKANPGLLYERMTGLRKPDRKQWDKSLMASLIILYVVWIAVMPLDAIRFQWSKMPIWLQAVGGAIFAITYYMLFLTYRENPFLSPAERIQTERGQTVISTGPYRYVRHPMYAISVVQFIGGSLLLGSWVGLLVGLLLIPLLARRTMLEETMLREELSGYQDYMARVKYRMIPHLW